MKSVTVQEAETNLSKLLVATASGEEFVVCRDDVPVAKLVPLSPRTRTRPKVGQITSKPVRYSDDCFLPLDAAAAAEWGLL